MTTQPFKTPEYKGSSFNCPFCNAFSAQSWFGARNYNRSYGSISDDVKDTDFCFCSHCHRYSIWHEEMMIFPEYMGIDIPNDDMGDDIISDYNEAASILQKSPRGSAALLRLALQKLCVQLGEKGKDLNTDISNLIKNGLPVKIQQSLDALRVIGNELVHPGQIDLRDDPETAKMLFKLLNKIAETMITEPREIAEIYDKIPDSKKEQITQRDGEVKK
jgi:hypothetical protein